MVEVDEERPVDEPCPRVKLGEGGVGGWCAGGRERGMRRGACVDGLAKGVELFKGDGPFSCQNV